MTESAASESTPSKSWRQYNSRPNSTQWRFTTSATDTKSAAPLLVFSNTESQASAAQRPSFSRTWSAPVPNDSSPQRNGTFSALSIRFPKYFQPVGVSKHLRPSFCATRSTAREVGIDRATARRPPRSGANHGTHFSTLAARTARESEGVTKNWRPTTMLRSPSPSKAAPKSYWTSVASGEPSASMPKAVARAQAHFRFGSGCAPPKSGRGSARSTLVAASTPSVSTKTLSSAGPAAPCMASSKSFGARGYAGPPSKKAFSLGKSKTSFKSSTYAAVPSTTSTVVPETESVPPRLAAHRASQSWAASTSTPRYSAIVTDFS
mmetsp:Transcript_25761/g.86570  ORF Transcript_25761/g.86570 Transcript_25761/m.86570 type:complete len:321 (-) Transcript_25761:579-1541(-)